MASKEPKISKDAAAGKTRDIILTIPKTLDIIRKPGSATNQNFIMAAYDNGFWTNCGIRKQRERITYKNLGQYR